MHTIWLVMKQEIKNTLQQKSFWIMTFLMPLILLGANSYALIQDYNVGSSSDAGNSATSGETASAEPTPAVSRIGLVDEGGLITQFPPNFPSDFFTRFDDATTARAALDANEIDQYVVIPTDYLQTGQVTVYDKDYQLMGGSQQMGAAFDGADEAILGGLINYNLTGDLPLTYAMQNPTPGTLATQHRLAPVVEASQTQDLAILVANLMPYIFYFLLIISSSYLMRSVVAEKENRTAEVLLLSVRPQELMIGKVLGLGVVTFIQLIVWLGGGYLILNRGAAYLNVSTYTFPPGFFLWALIFLVLGYMLYGSIMAAAGAIAQNARESGQVIWVLIIPLMPTLMFGSEMLANPHGTLAMVLSLFPFSAPSAMVTRIAVATVPLWQILVSVGGLALTAYVFILVSARFFRSGNLLSQETFNWKRFATAWRE
ncbi:MAG: ABC transporter permease [Anaerolineales bacterium]|nr:ABC transporter permease [Anaerolineales bacterium]